MPKLSQDYRVSPDGVTVYKLKKGDEVTGRIAEMAERAGVIDKRTTRKTPPKPAMTKPAMPEEPLTDEPETADEV